MRNITLYVLVIAFLSACNSSSEKHLVEKPEHLLTRQQMVELLTDIQLIEAAKTKNLIASMDSIKTIEESYGLVFKKHNINKQDFEQNLLYYYDFSGQMEEIYGEVLSELMKIEAELTRKEEAKD